MTETDQIKITEKLFKNWEKFSDSILDWRYKGTTDEVLFKFAWQPEDGEFLFSSYPTPHKVFIWNFGTHKFDEYIKGIYFRDKRIIYLRGHKREEWMKKTEKMLRQNGVSDDIEIIWGKEATKRMEEDLKGL